MNKNNKQNKKDPLDLSGISQLAKMLWEKPLIKFVIIAFCLLTIQGMILDAFVPAFFTDALFWTITGFEAAIYCFLKQDHYFEADKTQQGKIFMVLTFASVLMMLGYAIKTITLAIQWIMLS